MGLGVDGSSLNGLVFVVGSTATDGTVRVKKFDNRVFIEGVAVTIGVGCSKSSVAALTA